MLYGTEEKSFKHFRLGVLMAMIMGSIVFWYMISVARQRAESLDGYYFEITFIPQSTLCNCCSSNRQNTQSKNHYIIFEKVGLLMKVPSEYK